MIVIALICSICLSTSVASIPIVSQSVTLQQSGISSAEVPKGRLVVARRVVDGAYINFYEQGRGELEQKHFEAAVRWFILASETNPDRSGVFIYLASAYAGKGDKKKSLRALKTAVDHGFSDVAAIADNPLFDSIRDDAQYR